jgi:hypothetical protein
MPGIIKHSKDTYCIHGPQIALGAVICSIQDESERRFNVMLMEAALRLVGFLIIFNFI